MKLKYILDSYLGQNVNKELDGKPVVGEEQR
jgi:hypothetical protein